MAPGQLGAAGICIGGHLAFRAALRPDVKATVCFYPTGVHNGKLGQDDDAGTLQRTGEIHGHMLLVWGQQDPHIPEAGRAAVEIALRASGISFERRLYPAIRLNMPSCVTKARASILRPPTRPSPTR